MNAFDLSIFKPGKTVTGELKFSWDDTGYSFVATSFNDGNIINCYFTDDGVGGPDKDTVVFAFQKSDLGNVVLLPTNNSLVQVTLNKVTYRAWEGEIKMSYDVIENVFYGSIFGTFEKLGGGGFVKMENAIFSIQR